MRKNYRHHHCRYCLKQCLLFDRSPSLNKKPVVDNTVEGDNVVFDFEAKKGCSLCDRGCWFCYSEEDFLSKTSCTVVLGKTAGNHTRLSSCRKGPLARGGKGRWRLLLTAATILLLLLLMLLFCACCYAQLLCAFFKPIYRPAAQAFLATRLLPMTSQCCQVVLLSSKLLGVKKCLLLRNVEVYFAQRCSRWRNVWCT